MSAGNPGSPDVPVDERLVFLMSSAGWVALVDSGALADHHRHAIIICKSWLTAFLKAF